MTNNPRVEIEAVFCVRGSMPLFPSDAKLKVRLVVARVSARRVVGGWSFSG